MSSMYFTGKAQTIANETQNCKINILFNTYILTSLSAKFKQMKKNEGFYARREHINNRQMQSNNVTILMGDFNSKLDATTRRQFTRNIGKARPKYNE